jgi:hypothetical protein
MAYRFNGGNGAVTCDVCNVIFDEHLSHKEYVKNYGKNGNICWKCKEKIEKREKDLLNDGWRN